MTPKICPNCGAEVPPNATACPSCGADEETGWSDKAEVGGLDLPDEEFDYQRFVEREFGNRKPVPSGIHWFWWVIAAILLAVLFLIWVR